MGIRAKYQYDSQAASRAADRFTPGEDMAVQSGKDDADINIIVKRFGVTREVPVSGRVPSYQDFTDTYDFRTAQERIMEGQEAFLSVPSGIRAQFHNDPAAFVEYCSKPQNREQLKLWGLLKLVEEPKIPEPTRVVVVNQENSDGERNEGSGVQAGKVGKRAKGGTADAGG